MCLDQKAGKNATISRSGSSSLKEKPVGCVLERLIPAGKTFLVTFQHDQSGDEPDICWKTCQVPSGLQHSRTLFKHNKIYFSGRLSQH